MKHKDTTTHKAVITNYKKAIPPDNTWKKQANPKKAPTSQVQPTIQVAKKKEK